MTGQRDKERRWPTEGRRWRACRKEGGGKGGEGRNQSPGGRKSSPRKESRRGSPEEAIQGRPELGKMVVAAAMGKNGKGLGFGGWLGI